MVRARCGDFRGLLAAVVVALSFIAAPAASAEDPRTVGACAAAGEVWLHIQTDRGQVLRSECVGIPASGVAALENAAVAVTETSGGYVCTLARYPQVCPRRFAGQYWQYWQSNSLGASWTYSQKGAAKSSPVRGGVEGWCYNAADETRCQLPQLTPEHPTAPRIDAAPASSGGNPWWVAATAVILAVALVGLWRQRRP